jgi:two-component system OmpR family sensor kinase
VGKRAGHDCVVKNLVDNAIRYTPEGGRVDLSVGVSEGKAELRIQDSGPGIPLAERDRVFDPFYRTLGSEQMARVWDYPLSKRLPIASVLKSASTSQTKKQTGLNVAVIVPMR